jgi:hypothetical protein
MFFQDSGDKFHCVWYVAGETGMAVTQPAAQDPALTAQQWQHDAEWVNEIISTK